MLAACDLDGTAIDVDDAGTANAHPLGLVDRAVRRAGAVIAAVVAVVAVVGAITATDIDADAGVAVAAAEVEVKAVGLGCCRHRGDGAETDHGGKGGGPELAEHGHSPGCGSMGVAEAMEGECSRSG